MMKSKFMGASSFPGKTMRDEVLILWDEVKMRSSNSKEALFDQVNLGKGSPITQRSTKCQSVIQICTR